VRNIKIKLVAGIMVLLAVTGLALASIRRGPASGYKRTPSLLLVFDGLRASAGNELAFYLYSLAVEAYEWDDAVWERVEPVGMLFADRSRNR